MDKRRKQKEAVGEKGWKMEEGMKMKEEKE